MKLKIFLGIFLIIWAVGTYFSYTEILKNEYKDKYYYDLHSYYIDNQEINFAYQQMYEIEKQGVFRTNDERFQKLVNKVGIENLEISFLAEKFTRDKKSFTTTIWLKTSKDIYEQFGLENFGFTMNDYGDAGLLWIENVSFVVVPNRIAENYRAFEDNLELQIEHKTTWHKVKRVLMSPVYGVVVGFQLVGIGLFLLYLEITGEKLSIGW